MHSDAAPDTTAMIQALDNSGWRELLLGQLKADVEPYHRKMEMSRALEASETVGKLQSALAPSKADCARLLEIGLIGRFPSREPWPAVGEEILTWFWTLRHPSFSSTIESHYLAADDRPRACALALLAGQDSPEAAESIVRLLRDHPLPANMQPRFFWEMNARHQALGSRLFPRLLLDAGPHLAGIMNFMNVCLDAGTLEPGTLAPTSDWISSEANQLLDLMEPLQQTTGKRWRWSEDYGRMRSRLGVMLDLLGVIPGIPLEPCTRALQLNDPLCAFYALVSMLRRNQLPPAEALQFVAESLETRAPLHSQLARFGRLDLFPGNFLNFDSFAAASMAEWLLHPSELGYEPLRLDLVAKVSGDGEDRDVIMCLWKVNAEDQPAFASASGPYPADAPIGPVSGENTFSNFTDWDSQSPEEHLGEIVETLEGWRVQWCEVRN